MLQEHGLLTGVGLAQAHSWCLILPALPLPRPASQPFFSFSVHCFKSILYISLWVQQDLNVLTTNLIEEKVIRAFRVTSLKCRACFLSVVMKFKSTKSTFYKKTCTLRKGLLKQESNLSVLVFLLLVSQLVW